MQEPSARRVAVVIPCYNDGATLPEALASLDRQEPSEVVVFPNRCTRTGYTARMLMRDRENHNAVYADLRRRHPAVFEHRRENWRASRASIRLRLLLPALEAIPGLSDHTRLRLGHVVKEPAYLLKRRLRRRLPGGRRVAAARA